MMRHAGQYYDRAVVRLIRRAVFVGGPGRFCAGNPDLYGYVDSSSPNGTDESGLIEENPSSLVPAAEQTGSGWGQRSALSVGVGLSAAMVAGVGFGAAGATAAASMSSGIESGETDGS